MNAIDIFRLLDDCGISDEKLETWSKEDLLSLFYEIYWSLACCKKWLDHTSEKWVKLPAGYFVCCWTVETES